MPSTMTTIDLRCPNCGSDFTSKTVESANLRVRQHTDFYPEATGVQPIRYAVHRCPNCGFAGRDDSFSGLQTLGYEVRQRVWDELAPRVTDTAPASETYEFAAKIATWDGADAVNIGDLWLRAAWCCVDEGDIEAERYYRRYAARSFEEALEHYDEIEPDERAKITYLVGELWRRIGDGARANSWFDRVADEITSPTSQSWLVDLARGQQDDPEEWLA